MTNSQSLIPRQTNREKRLIPETICRIIGYLVQCDEKFSLSSKCVRTHHTIENLFY